MAKCYIFEAKRRLSTNDIDKMSMGDPKFIIFCLSKPIYKYNQIKMINYNKVFSDITDLYMLPPWMETDMLYTFKLKLLKKEVKNNMIPYHQIIDFKNLFKVEFIDCKYIAIRLSMGRMTHKKRMQFEPKVLQSMDKKDFSKVFLFENMIEGYKFYSYCKSLIKNQHEFYNTLKYRIHFNLGKQYF